MTVKTWLQREGHRVEAFTSPEAFLRGVRETKPDLVLLDVVFGPVDGRLICKSLRQDPATKGIAVILASAHRQDVADLVDGLERGADDYLLKPLDRTLTLAKVNSVMQRFQTPDKAEETLQHCGLRLDLRERTARVGEREVPLTRMEFNLLTHFLSNASRVLTARQLLESVWGYEPEAYNDPATVQVHISRLRKKLGETFSSRLSTLVNVGYRLD